MPVPFRRTAVAAALALAAAAAQAQPAGSIAFTSFNADEDGFSIVALADLAPGSVVHFNDNEWNGSAIGAGGAFNTGEGTFTWNTGAATIAAGTVVRFTSVDVASRSASIGTLTGVGDNGMNATNETIYAFLGSNANTPTTFLAAISNGGFGSNGTLANTGLTVGTNAVQLAAGTDFAQYTGARSGLNEFSAYLPLVTSNGNWFNGGDGIFTTTAPDTTAFTVQPIPEPSELAFMLAGLGLAGAVAGRPAHHPA